MSNNHGTVLDTAAYILKRYNSRKYGHMTVIKLQKLVYYSQAWSLTWTGKPLFHEKIEAWIHGPLVYDLFDLLQGGYYVHRLPPGTGATIRNLNEEQRATIDSVVEFYGPMEAGCLTTLTHQEKPWQQARARDNVGPDRHSRLPITHGDMQDYYGSLIQRKQAA